jgi:leader peptidase (prepilin peptidase)/N-methyltransferase
MNAYGPVAVFLLLGLCFGSFFNVLIWRLPKEDESIVRPASRCPSCKRPIPPWENVPVLSFLLLRGKCAGCGISISWRYPLVEALTGAGFAFFAWHDGAGWLLVRDLVLFSILVPVAFIDIDTRTIPDELSLGGVALGLALSLFPGGSERGSILGMFAGGGFLYLTALGYERIRKEEGLGMGDVKLLAAVGAFLGVPGALLTIFGGSLLGLLGAVPAMLEGDKGLKTAIPFGPFLCAAALLSRFLAGPLFRWLFPGL